MKIVLVAGDNKAKNLIRSFNKKKHEMVFINQNKELCQKISREFDLKHVICGDATKPSTLKEARIKNYDLIIALCPNDADNIVACRLADTFNIKRKISIVNNPSNINAFDKLGIDTTISIASIISLVIEKNAFTESIESLLPIEDGKALLLEVEIEEGFLIAGKQLKDANLPEDCNISCIMRNGDAIIPRGNTTIQVGDKIIAITLPSAKQKLIKTLTVE